MVKSVVEEGPVERKGGPVKKFKKTFFGGDIQSVTHHIMLEVLIPAIKNLMFEAGRTGLEQMVFGEDRPVRRGRSRERNYRYDNPTSPKRRGRGSAYLPDQGPRPSRGDRPRPRADTGDIILPRKADAERVLEMMHELIDQYEVATVADMFELMGLASNHVDNKFGWYDLPYSKVEQVREGWLIVIPDAEPIEDEE